jgi:mannose-1-phosphate guanylyltransferase
MLAYVRAAGLGTRLRPLTERVPKCLVPIAGRPLLGWWFELLAQHGVDRVVLNVHSHPEQVNTYVAALTTPIRVKLVHEPTLLGSAGTLRTNRAAAMNDADLTALLAVHRRSNKLATLGLFKAPIPEQCGIVEVDGDGIIRNFEEKPRVPRSNLAFSGVLVGTPALLDQIPDTVPCDLGREVLPKLTNRMAAWRIPTYLRDIGTPEAYEAAQTEALSLQGFGK